MELQQLLQTTVEMGASDLHLKAGRPALVRVDGSLQALDGEAVTSQWLEGVVDDLLSPREREKLEENRAVDLGYGLENLARFRGSIFQQRGTLAIAMRQIPFEVPTVEGLDLPDSLLGLTDLPMGLILITGPTGCGKSTTLAALLQRILQQRADHVITIEDPLEFLLKDDVGSCAQRELGIDTPTFREALRNSLRQDPDVLMVGEMRDLETMETVISAAETGHLVFSTVHTNSAAETIDRIIDTFPSRQQSQIRAQLSLVLSAVISMRLVRRSNGEGRIAAVEIMRRSPQIAKLIHEGRVKEIPEEIESSVSYYRMQTLNQSLIALIANGFVDYQEAHAQSPDRDDLTLKLRKLIPQFEGRDDMAPSPADFSILVEAQEAKQLFEQEKVRLREQMNEKDARITSQESQIEETREELKSLREFKDRNQVELARLRESHERERAETQNVVDRLNQRVRELNQKIQG